MRLHDPHGAAPGQVDAAVEQSGHRVAGHRRADEVDVDAFALIEAERLGRIEGRVEYRAEIFGQPDFHSFHTYSLMVRSARSARLEPWAACTALAPGPSFETRGLRPRSSG